MVPGFPQDQTAKEVFSETESRQGEAEREGGFVLPWAVAFGTAILRSTHRAVGSQARKGQPSVRASCISPAGQLLIRKKRISTKKRHFATREHSRSI